MVTGMSNMEVRNANRDHILQVIRENGMLTKKDISLKLNLSLATVTSLIKELVEEGLVEAGKASDSTGGRKPILYQPVADARISLGIALSRHHIRMVLANWNQKIFKSESFKIAYENTEAYWADLRKLVDEFLEVEYEEDGCFKGIGICIQGIIPPGNNWDDIIPVELFEGIRMDEIKKLFPCPVFFFENMKAAAYSQIGEPGQRRRTVYLQLDRLVGGAVVADGTFWGLSERTGEFGHMIIRDDGDACYCGQRGCLQTCCSSEILRDKSGLDLPEFFEALERQDPVCRELWEDYLKYLVRAIRNLKVIFDIDITLGGEMVPYLKKYERRLTKMLAEMDLYKEPVMYLKFSEGGALDAAIGAAHLIFERV